MTQTDLGSWIRESRKTKGWTQAQLGSMLDLSQAQVSQLENDKLRPDGEVLRQLNVLFGPTPAAGAASTTAAAAKPTAAMKRTGRRKKKGVETADYRHTEEKRKNIPPAKIAAEGKVPAVPKARYYYNPHLPPVLRFDPTGEADRVHDIIAEAGSRPLRPEEQSLISEAVSHYDPWLEWSGKQEEHEQQFFEVEPVALHIHERVSAQAIVRAATRENPQKSLFADPEQPYHEAVQFYRHDVDWANRLILGDSVQVMSSLARREGLAGKVQMVYVDPPYGIKFASNFQPLIGRRAVKDKDEDLSRESETVQAYRDTWHLGLHSYLSYLLDRMIVARDLLCSSGSIFVQISDENVHLVRQVLDSVFGRNNFVSMIAFTKTSGLEAARRVSSRFDYLLWYAREIEVIKYRPVFEPKTSDKASAYTHVELPTGMRRRLSSDEQREQHWPAGALRFTPDNLTKPGPGSRYEIFFEGQSFDPGKRWWGTTPEAMSRLAKANRLIILGNSIRLVRYLEDHPYVALTNLWTDTGIAGFSSRKQYVVETNPKVVERCILMTTDPGDLVLDPTCGSGTTAFVAEQWGRRWIGIDTSRVAIAIARQRIVAAKFEHYRIKGELNSGGPEDPGAGFTYRLTPHITQTTIAQNTNLDPIFEKYESILDYQLKVCNDALAGIPHNLVTALRTKLKDKLRAEGTRAITDADRRRWELPIKGGKWEHWLVPFDSDSDWPEALQRAVTDYREAWRAKMGEVNACIAANAPQEELVDQPEIVKGVLRVSGPFTVEGVHPEELSLGEKGLFDGTPNEFEENEEPAAAHTDLQNLNTYLTKMVQLLRGDGVTFPNNQHRTFARIEPLFETGVGSILHAEGLWEGDDQNQPNSVAIGFGPQYGPVTAVQVEELIRASRRYDELVVAGFSFEAAASAVIQESSHPRLQIHQAYIRPDVNPGMEGLLKETPNSQLFTVFGQPDIDVRPDGDGKWLCELLGVDIYDPLTSEVKSTGASKVAAWFLDQDYDGRCFCITQAFFPDQKAWDKIAKALGSSADPEAFAAFEGTVSLPFNSGKYKRIAVKVIDPRGNEVMAIRGLEG